jgi:hypothetical protein
MKQRAISYKKQYVVMENLLFHKTAAYKPDNFQTDGGWDVLEMAVFT